MKKGNLILILFVVFMYGFQSASACSYYTTVKRNNFSDTTIRPTDGMICDRVFALPEVQKQNRFIDSISGHKHGVSLMISERPKSPTGYYWVQVGYNNEERFEVHLNFYVYLPKLNIKIMDTNTGKLYTLAAWRKLKREH